MVTSAGNQPNPLNAITEALDLEYNIKETYVQAIEKINGEYYKYKLKEFLDDHEHHIEELSNFLKTHHKQQVSSKLNKLRSTVTKVKLIFANLVGDRAILSAISNNELDPSKVYERINARHDIKPEAKEIFKQALKDEKRHKSWLDDEIKQWQSN